MTAAEYRERAEALLTSRHHSELREQTIQQADVWARLAVSAAISETAAQDHKEVQD
ncbi:hypothetical protein GCM10012287_16760 [Streptomyces daqingensis]|uniref:Uncharacterized protein n=1 Tax=Streptomyces daqingensis TaxID=1472640 RepID=A0ABQ2M3J6_9ACTN|nr:hypothetical protein [Streptomyces daqingensis]GGO46436.1 hypothetical protein GCM10012287_16760 [Streptomyces daqingensis]